MSTFGTLTILLALIVAALFVRRCIQRKAFTSADRRQTRPATIDDLRREFDCDRAARILASERAAGVPFEAEQTAPIEDDAARPASAASARWQKLAMVLALVTPLAVASAIYLLWGRANMPGAKSAAASAPAAASGHDMGLDKLASRLAERLEHEGGDADAWALLGRAQQRIGKYAKAIDSFTRALASRPKDADVLADLADTLLMAQEKRWTTEASDAVRRALQVNPVHARALALSADEQMAGGDYRAALQTWKKVESIALADPELAAAAADGIRKASAQLGGDVAAGGGVAQALADPGRAAQSTGIGAAPRAPEPTMLSYLPGGGASQHPAPAR